MDYVTPLCTQVTYEGLLDDTFGISSGLYLRKIGKCKIALEKKDTVLRSCTGVCNDFMLISGFVEFGSEVTGTDKSMKMLLTGQDSVSFVLSLREKNAGNN